MRRLAVLFAFLVAALAPASAEALTKRQIFGIGNAEPGAFSDPRLLALEPGAARMIADWDVAWTPGYERDRVDAWYDSVIAAGVRPLFSFQGLNRPGAPSVARYARAVRAAMARWPLIREWQAWNEANHRTQPATYRHPGRAARYAKVLDRYCRRPSCTALPVTLQISESRSTAVWVKRFKRAYGRTPRIWALHGYSDANRFTYRRLRSFLRAHRRGRVWITESGALAKFAATFPYDLGRQRRVTPYVFRAAVLFRRRVDRLYWWQWRGAERPRRIRWDSGLIDATGAPRPAYAVALRARFARP